MKVQLYKFTEDKNKTLTFRWTKKHFEFCMDNKIFLNHKGKKSYKERNLFLRGMVPLIGYKTSCVYYARKERMAGESKYPLKKMLSFAFDGITSFSIKPITMISWVGFLAIVFSVCAMIYTFIGHFVGNTVSGWSSLMISIWFLGGVQLLSIGVIGQYIGKTYVEVKERPRYNIDVLLEYS